FLNSPSNECSGLWPGSGKSLSAPSCMGWGLRCESWPFMELLLDWLRSSGSLEPFPRSASLWRWSLTLVGMASLSMQVESMNDYRVRLRRMRVAGNVLRVGLYLQVVVMVTIGKFN